jgi:C-terminal processing protease CtpA/Prc
VKVVEVTQDMLLGVSIEGGTDTKHGGSILVKSIESNEAIKNQKTVTVGDQILMVHGQSMVDITHHEASIILKQAIETDRETISLLVAVETN